MEELTEWQKQMDEKKLWSDRFWIQIAGSILFINNFLAGPGLAIILSREGYDGLGCTIGFLWMGISILATLHYDENLRPELYTKKKSKYYS